MTALKWIPLCVIGVLLLAVLSTTPAADQSSPDTGPLAEPAAADAGQADTASASQAASGAATLIAALTVFVLAIFVGFEVITKVPPTLHTPLMSGSNAISGITIIGALILAGALDSPPLAAKIMAFVAVIFATINVVGGYLVTDRMLRMFKRK
jgi:NAD(P) transhydrogenase subunit alpha